MQTADLIKELRKRENPLANLAADRLEQLHALAEKTAEMRALQKIWFAPRTRSKTALANAKAMEKTVDFLLSKHKISPTPPPQKLF